MAFLIKRIHCTKTGLDSQTHLTILFWKNIHHLLEVVILNITQLL